MWPEQYEVWEMRGSVRQSGVCLQKSPIVRFVGVLAFPTVIQRVRTQQAHIQIIYIVL
jgi:hypothetical protein